MKEYDPKKINWLVALLCRWFPYKEIGWKDIDEVFFRWTLAQAFGYKLVLHRLDAENWHVNCHDHPWDFLAIVIGPGYYEMLDPKQKIRNKGRDCGRSVYWRGPLSLLWRPAESKHNVITKPGKPNWSLVLMKPKRRGWGFMTCE
jgi:hypothetical protein